MRKSRARRLVQRLYEIASERSRRSYGSPHYGYNCTARAIRVERLLGEEYIHELIVWASGRAVYKEPLATGGMHWREHHFDVEGELPDAIRRMCGKRPRMGDI